MTHIIKPFKTNQQSGPNFVSGGLLNDMAAALNMARLYTAAPVQQVSMGIGYCTSHADTCTEIDDASEENVSAPCRSHQKGYCRFRKFDPSTGVYFDLDDTQLGSDADVPIDYGCWWPDDATSGPLLLEDDIFPAYYEITRGMVVPLWVPMTRPVILTTTLASNSTATAAVLKRTTTSPFWQKRTGIELTVCDLSLNASDEPWPIGVKGHAIWQSDHWLFVPLSCEADDTGIE